MKAFVTIIVFLALVQGCTSFKTVDNQSTAVTVSNLVIGDKVQIVTADGEKVRLTIDSIEDDALIGDGVRVPIANIRIVSIESFDSGETALLGFTTAGIILIGLVIVGIAVLVP